LATTKHIFATNGAVVFVLVFETLVGLKDGDRDAHAALVAVAKRFHTTHTTESTLHTMKRLFGLQWRKRKNKKRFHTQV